MRLVALILTVASLAVAPAQQPPVEEQQRILSTAREAALRYIAALPNFICTESVMRTERFGVRNVTADKLTIELTYTGRQERYKLTAINGNPTEKSLDSVGGLISGGEFGSLMLRIFEPSSAADFEWKGWSNLRKRRAAVFTYRVPRARSHYVLGYRAVDGSLVSATAGYRGEVFLDAEAELGRVLRLTAEADDIPKESGILRSFMAVDYDFVNVSGRSYALPLRAESALARPHREIQNLVTFVGYRKFEVESTVDFGSAPQPGGPIRPRSPEPLPVVTGSQNPELEVPPPAAPPLISSPSRRFNSGESQSPAVSPPPPAVSVEAVPEPARPKTPEFETPGTSPSPPAAPPVTFRTTSQLALIGFQIISKKGQLIRDLKPEEIELREDGVPQKIAVFEGGAGRARTIPVEVALLFDCSLSVEVAGALNTRVFQQNILDEFENLTVAIYGFSDSLVRATKPTRDPAILKKAADSVRTITPLNTPLFGAIADTARDFGSGGGTAIRMMAILSDGESYWPGDLERTEEAVRAARESGISLYPVMLAKSAVTETRLGVTAPVAVHPARVESASDFTGLASATGGRSLSELMNTDVLPSVLRSIATQIRGSYVAGYYPPSSPTPKPHNVEVVLRPKNRGRIYGGIRTVVH